MKIVFGNSAKRATLDAQIPVFYENNLLPAIGAPKQALFNNKPGRFFARAASGFFLVVGSESHFLATVLKKLPCLAPDVPKGDLIVENFAFHLPHLQGFVKDIISQPAAWQNQ